MRNSLATSMWREIERVKVPQSSKCSFLLPLVSQERQKLSFFLVVIFLGVFALIVLAEVLFMDGEGAGGVGGALGVGGGRFPAAYYEEDGGGGGDGWETPRPLVAESPSGSSGAVSGLRWMLGRGRQHQEQQQRRQSKQHERFQKSLAKHQVVFVL